MTPGTLTRIDRTAIVMLATLWTPILAAPLVGPNATWIGAAAVVGLVIGGTIAWLADGDAVSAADAPRRDVWQSALVFGATVLASAVVLLYLTGFAREVLGAPAGSPTHRLVAVAFVLVPPALGAAVVRGYRAGRLSIPEFLVVRRWGASADVGLLLVTALVAATYAQSLLPADAAALAPLLPVAALVVGLLHVAIRRAGAFQTPPEPAHPETA